MDLMSLQIANHQITLRQTPQSGVVTLLLDEQPVVENHTLEASNRFPLMIPELGQLELWFDIDQSNRQVVTTVKRNGDVLFSEAKEIQPAPSSAASGFRGHIWAWIGVALKLFKSVKVVQVALVGMSLSAWGILFSWEFAAAIVGILIFHEYGHLRAMKKCGIPTKGIYLIPFVGGVAVGERARTHWEEVYIAMMGPFFGLAMTLVFGVGYALTGNHFMGLVTSIGALVNLFNLLPVMPLDGGQVFKAMALSGQKKAGMITVGLLTAIGLVMAYRLGFYLLIFFLILGVVDLLASWKQFKHNPGMTMTAYGIVFSLVWYLLTAAAFIGTIVLMAGTGLPGTELAVAILRD